MPSLISIASGNFTSSSTWATVDASSILNSEAANTALTTSYVRSAAFTPGAITIDAIAVKVASRAASPTGTMSVSLYNETLGAVVTGTTVTINVSDIQQTNAASTGFYVFAFAAPVLLLVATQYSVQALTSSASQVNLFRDTTAGNWSRLLRTTTTAAPASTDPMFVCGQHTAAATNSSYTVTLNNTATTTFGRMECSARGVLTYGNSASTNYYLRLGGNLDIYSNGAFYIGSSTLATPIPSTSTAVLEFDATTNAEFGIEVRTGARFEAQGATVVTKALLAANASAAATSLTTNVSTSWLNGDTIALASTSQTATQAESRALTAGASGTTLTITAIGNAHTGTSPVQAELLNLTRNVRIRGESTTLQAYMNVADGVVDMDYVEISNMGSALTNRRGVNVATILGSFSAVGCSFYNFLVTASCGIICTTATYTNLTIDNCVFYNLYEHFNLADTFGLGGVTINDSYFVYSSTQWLAIVANPSITFTNNRMANGQSGCLIIFSTSAITGTFSTNTIHSSTTSNLALINLYGGTLTGFTLYRSSGNAINMAAIQGGGVSNITFDNFTIFGNSNGVSSSYPAAGRIVNSSIYGGSTFVQAAAIDPASAHLDLIIENTAFGTPSAHSTADINISAKSTSTIICRDCLFSSTTEVGNQTNLLGQGIVGSSRHDQTDNNHRSWKNEGNIAIDTTIFRNASPSARMSPNSGTRRLESGKKAFAVTSGNPATISVYVRTSVSGDGTAYNGAAPRLILKSNSALGVDADVVLDTYSVAAGNWEQLTGTTPTPPDNGVFEVVVDGNGGLGWFNVDDWSLS